MQEKLYFFSRFFNLLWLTIRDPIFAFLKNKKNFNRLTVNLYILLIKKTENADYT